MRSGGPDVSEIPRLDAFDEEFGREPVVILRDNDARSDYGLRMVVLLLGAGIVSALALAWLNADGWLRSAPSPPAICKPRRS
jgi:hypothetical protein